MNVHDDAQKRLPVWAEWLLALWIFGAAFFYFVRMSAILYRTYGDTIAGYFQ